MSDNDDTATAGEGEDAKGDPALQPHTRRFRALSLRDLRWDREGATARL